jgi:hypothetical protein
MANDRPLMTACIAAGLLVLPAAAQNPQPNPPGRTHLSFVNFASDRYAIADQPPDAAAEPAPAPRAANDEWHFTLAPYLWAMSMRVEAGDGSASSTSEACFLDLLNSLDGAAQLRFEGIKDRWGFFLDGTYLTLSDDANVRTDRFRVRGIDVDMHITEAWLDFGGMYRFGDPGFVFDLMLGGRYAYVATEISVGPFDVVDSSSDFLAPLIGGRLEFDLSDRWMMSVKGEVGGFGVGDAADLTWGATGLFGYRASESMTLGFGYRIYAIDLKDDGVDLDLQLHGPIVGAAFSF